MSLHSLGYLFSEGLKSLWKNRTMSIASIGVLIACLLMTGVAGLLSLNLSTVMATVESNNSITVFLDADVPSLTAVKIGEEIRQIDNVATCTFRQKDDALADIIHSMSGDQGSSSSGEDSGDLFYGLQGSDNPLPDSYVISMDDLSQYSATAAQIEAIDGVDYVNNYQEVASMLSNMERLVRICSIGILALLAIVSLFIIANTVKVTLFSRRMEINIMKSVGATNSFVRLPFIVEGVVIGLLSGLISATVLYFAYDKAVEVAYGIVPFLTFVNIHPYVGWLYLGYIVAGMCFGILGGVISIGRYLKREGEDAIV